MQSGPWVHFTAVFVECLDLRLCIFNLLSLWPRCFGLLISSVQVVKGSEMNLLDNMAATVPDNRTFIVTGLWDSSSHHLAALNQDTKGGGEALCVAIVPKVLECSLEG